MSEGSFEDPAPPLLPWAQREAQIREHVAQGLLVIVDATGGICYEVHRTGVLLLPPAGRMVSVNLRAARRNMLRLLADGAYLRPQTRARAERAWRELDLLESLGYGGNA